MQSEIDQTIKKETLNSNIEIHKYKPSALVLVASTNFKF